MAKGLEGKGVKRQEYIQEWVSQWVLLMTDDWNFHQQQSTIDD